MATGTVLKGVKRWDTVEGKVVEVTAKALYLDLGAKTQGMVADKEYDAAKEYIRSMKPGDKVTGVVYSPENDSGYILISLKRAAADQRWGDLEERVKSGESLAVRVKEANKGGLLVEIDGIVGFLPGSQVGKAHAGNMEELVGRSVDVIVMEADRATTRLIVSEKAVSDAGDIEARKKLMAKVKMDDVYDGEVTGVVPFGIFVKIPQDQKTKIKDQKDEKESVEQVNLEGLVHISELSWEKVDDPKDFYKDGDQIKVKVIGVDEASGRLALSVKQMTDDPWQDLVKKYPVDHQFKGIVARLVAYGAFVEIERGLEGLIHISKIPPEMKIDAGDEVSCYIESIDAEHKKISLGLVLTEKPLMYK